MAVKMTLIKVRNIKIDMLLQYVGIVNDQKNLAYCQSYLHFRLKPGVYGKTLNFLLRVKVSYRLFALFPFLLRVIGKG